MSDDEDDDIAEVPHPRETFALFGHAEAEQTLLAAYRGGRIPHAWLIGGPAGIGKATLAYRMARFVLAHPKPAAAEVQSARSLAVAADHPVARHIASQAHPDLLVLERVAGDSGKLNQDIKVEQVRRSVGFFGSTAGEGGWRVAIVDSLDELNQAGENALLKVLEEPPAKSLLLMISHAPGQVLATIRSRCRQLNLRTLDGADVARAAAAASGRGAADAEIEEAAAASDGSVARALALLDGDTLALRRRVADLLKALPQIDARALHALGDALGGADQRKVAGVIDAINGWLSAQVARVPQDKSRLARVAEAWEKVNRAAAEAEEFNLDRKPLIFNMFGVLAEAVAWLIVVSRLVQAGPIARHLIKMAKKSYYLTTAIAYPNGAPHIGHAYEAIATDAIARFMRLDGYDVFFVTGTDEHGQKIRQTAAQEGVTPRELVDRNVLRFRAMVERMNCSNDDFIRTTEERHHRSSVAIWERMAKAGDIYLSKYAGWYSVRDEAYYAESETKVGDDKLRRSPHGSPVEWVEEESYFFKLSAYQDKLLDLYAKQPDFVLPKERLNEVASFVRSGLQDLSISRTTFDWGIKVPGDPKHIMYVWVDALTNYITAAGFPDTKSEKFRRYWPADLHVIGKDIVRFHAVYWPAFLMSAGLEIPRRIFSHGFLFNRGEKMSKSVGNVIDPFALADAYGVDPLRYFFLREVPFGQDGNYSHEAIVARINADLANDLGNLAQRSLSMIAKQCGGVLPAAGKLFGERQNYPSRGGCDDSGRARADENAAIAPSAQSDLGGRRRCQPLFRRRSAMGTGQNRRQAHGDCALCHRRGDPANCHPGAAFHAGINRETSRLACGCGR